MDSVSDVFAADFFIWVATRLSSVFCDSETHMFLGFEKSNDTPAEPSQVSLPETDYFAADLAFDCLLATFRFPLQFYD